jgi:iron complex outermembrane receptor protein
MPLRLYFYLTIAWLLMPLAIQAQNGSLSGIIQAEGGPAEFASVGFPNLGLGTITKSDGSFEIKDIPAGKHLLEISLLGYALYADSVTIKPGEVVTLNTTLTPQDLQLNEITVIDEQTGLTSQTPYNVTTLSARNIEFRGNPSGMMGFLRQEPGVYGAEMGQGIVKPFIRGLGFSRVVTVYQGNKLENHQWGADHGLGLNDLGVKTVELIKGPASLLYGSGAIGGVILVKDEEDYLQSRDWMGTLGMTYNSVSGGLRPLASIGKSYDNGFFVALDGAFESHADYIDGNGRVIGNSRFNTQTYRAHIGLDKKHFKNKLSYTYHNQALGIIEEDEMDDEETLATTRYDRKMQLPLQRVTDHVISYRQTLVKNEWVTAFNISHHINDRNEIEDDLDEVDLGLLQSHTFYNLRASHRTSRIWENTFGIQGSIIVNRNKQDVGEILIPDANLYENGIYYMANVTLGDYFLQGGLRYDYRVIQADASSPQLIDYGFILPGEPADRKLSRDFAGFTGTFGITRALPNNNQLKLNFSTGYRGPDLAELFSNGPHPGTNRFEVGNAEFGREQSYQTDLTWTYTKKKIRTSVAVFSNWVDNFIFFAATGETQDDGLEIWAFQQANALLYGSEFSVSYRPYGTDKLVVAGDASLIRGLKRNSDEYLTFIPADNYMLRLHYQPLGNNTTIHSTLRFVANQDRPGLNELPTDSYLLLNAGINHTFTMGRRNLALGLSVFNLLNRVYVDHMSILRAFNVTHPGRNFMVNVQYKF